MKRIFGTAKKEEAPKVEFGEVSDRMDKRTSALDTKINDIDTKLKKYKDQISSARSPAAQRAAKQQALRLLKQKKLYEGQRDQMFAQQMNLESTLFMTEQMKDTADQVNVMKQAQSALATQMQHVNIDDVDELQEKMQDLWYDHEEIQDMLGRSFAVQDDIDEDELMGELDLIEDELALEVDSAPATGVPTFLEEPDLPAVPTGHAADLLPEIQQPERPL
eukprot:jgi/Ulvmu1/9702/UM055_0040.1